MPPIAGANSLVNSRMFTPAPSIGRRPGGKSARILNFLMIAEHPRELGARGERPDAVGNLYRIYYARLDGRPDIDEPLDERIRHVVAAAVPRHQIAAEARADHGFELRQ